MTDPVRLSKEGPWEAYVCPECGWLSTEFMWCSGSPDGRHDHIECEKVEVALAADTEPEGEWDESAD